MTPALFGEFMGTLVLVLLGNGTVANVVLKKTLGHNSGWAVITTGFAFAVLAGVFTAIACGSYDKNSEFKALANCIYKFRFCHPSR